MTDFTLPELAGIAHTGLVDDTRGLQPGQVLVWDDRIKPGAAEKLFAEARQKGAVAILANVAGEGVTRVDQPGAVLARWAAAQWPAQPAVMLGVTGTSGKSSVAWFAQALAQAAGRESAAVGTLGVIRHNAVAAYTGYTSPTALKLHPQLQQLAQDGVAVCTLEVSSHALDLRRLEGVNFKAAGYTNLSQDHLDYHGTMVDYGLAKLRLFSEVLDPARAVAVLNILRPESVVAASVYKQRSGTVLPVGTRNAELVVAVDQADARGLALTLKFDATPVAMQLPLIGEFQAENLAVALGLLVAGGLPWADLAQAARGLTGVPGRMELLTQPGKPAVVVDYAHKPEALKKALAALGPLVDRPAGGEIWVVFGCGGNRDAGKRPLMGGIAARLADRVIITDDNPRQEDAAVIRQQVLAGARAAGGTAKITEIGDRRAAIEAALNDAGPQDVVLVAGKGHEDGQIVGDTVLPFDDRVVVQELLG